MILTFTSFHLEQLFKKCPDYFGQELWVEDPFPMDDHPESLRAMTSVLPMDYSHVFQLFYFSYYISTYTSFISFPNLLGGILLVSRWILSECFLNTQKFGMHGMTQPEKWPRLDPVSTGRWENSLASLPPLTDSCGAGWMAANALRGLGRLCCWGVGMQG